MIALVLPALSVLLAYLHLAFTKQPLTRERIAEILLLYLLSILVGVGGLFAFLWHTLRAPLTAQFVGWPPGNPFQYEVAVANLAFGILGILCIWKRGSFWSATAIGWSVFLLGAAGVHLHEIRAGQPYAPGNAAPVLFLDIALPPFVLGLLAMRGKAS